MKSLTIYRLPKPALTAEEKASLKDDHRMRSRYNLRQAIRAKLSTIMPDVMKKYKEMETKIYKSHQLEKQITEKADFSLLKKKSLK